MQEIHGVTVPFDAPPRRVVSLVPSLTQTFFELNLGDRVVGITDYCTEPAAEVARLPRVGGVLDPDIAAVLALNPDLVMVDKDENRLEDAQTIEEAGVTVWAAQPRRVKDVIDLMWAMMYAFDEASMVPRVRVIEQAMDRMENAALNETQVRIFAPVWRDPWMTFGRDTYIHDLLYLCGASNVFGEAGDGRRYFEVTENAIVAAQPEVVLLPQDDPYAFSQKDVDDLHRLHIPAAQSGRIHLVDGSHLAWYGTQTARALGELPHVIRHLRHQ
jgi:ABC-type Fe3+-hydroxamate transport system substrate-binding protein